MDDQVFAVDADLSRMQRSENGGPVVKGRLPASATVSAIAPSKCRAGWASVVGLAGMNWVAVDLTTFYGAGCKVSASGESEEVGGWPLQQEVIEEELVIDPYGMPAAGVVLFVALLFSPNSA